MKQPDTIIISPIGDIPTWISRAICKRVARYFGFKTKITSILNDISFAHDKKRNQYYSTQILEQIEKKSPKECLKLLAITREDLFIPILTHVYGEAQLGGTASIISTSRLILYPASGSMELDKERLVKEAAHELGHTFDLRHCEDPLCMMHYCRKLKDVDLKSSHFCRYCGIILSDHIKRIGE